MRATWNVLSAVGAYLIYLSSFLAVFFAIRPASTFLYTAFLSTLLAGFVLGAASLPRSDWVRAPVALTPGAGEFGLSSLPVWSAQDRTQANPPMWALRAGDAGCSVIGGLAVMTMGWSPHALTIGPLPRTVVPIAAGIVGIVNGITLSLTKKAYTVTPTLYVTTVFAVVAAVVVRMI